MERSYFSIGELAVVHSDQYPYRELHDAMVGCNGRFPSDKLSGWHRSYPDEARWLETFAGAVGPEVPVSEEDGWRLYALSRVLEVMNLTFQHGDGDGWSGPGLALADVSAFATDLSLSVAVPRGYTPFECEIVGVVEARDDSEEIRLAEVHWPSMLLGNMLVCRAGVTVCAGPRVINPIVASSSTLYWAYRRRNRAHQDRSHGWGHNSQWRTSFRRDYQVGTRVFYNVDGRCDLAANDLAIDEDFPLTQAERVELLVNRCFILTPKPSDDLWPYDDRVAINAGA